jgi:hypothetical protein
MNKQVEKLPCFAICCALATTLSIGVGTTTARAHHSPFQTFDLSQIVEIEGVVTQFLWRYPHVYVDVEVERPDGETVIYEVEAAWPRKLERYGWSREMLQAGDRVTFTGNPALNEADTAFMGRSLMIEGASAPLEVNPFPGAAAPDIGSLPGDRGGQSVASALIGTWLPIEGFNVLEAFANESILTAAGKAAIESMNDLNPDEVAVARCVPHSPPFNMLLQEAKTFESRGSDVVIRLAVDGDVERVIQMTGTVPVDEPSEHQGRSRGHWEGDTLVAETTFEQIDNPAAVSILGVPATGTRLIERFALSEERNELEYSYSVENPVFLLQTLTGSIKWGFRTGLSNSRLECDPEVARRFLAP